MSNIKVTATLAESVLNSITVQAFAGVNTSGTNGALCRGMCRKDTETAVRRVLCVLSLAKKSGSATVDDA